MLLNNNIDAFLEAAENKKFASNGTKRNQESGAERIVDLPL
jgi:hypothetical protein